MSIRFQKRIGGSKGLGINVSKSGLSPSYRTNYGSFSSKGFSIKSGIPGLSFRSSFGRGKNKGTTALIILAIIISGVIIYYSLIILYNLALFIIWLTNEMYKFVIRMYYKWKYKTN